MTAVGSSTRSRTGATSTTTRQRRRPASRSNRSNGATQDARTTSTSVALAGGDDLVPVTGILDVRDSFAFVRTGG